MYAARAVGTEVVREIEEVKERGRERERERVSHREFIEREWYEEVRRRDMIRKIQGMILEIKRIYSYRT